MGSTVEQQPAGKLVQQSFGEAPRVKLSKLTQSKPKPICDRSGKPEDAERVFVDEGKTSRSHEIDDKRLHKELGSSDRSEKPEKLSEDISVKHAHDGTREPVKSSASTHTVKEQFVLGEHRDIASFNADNEFNRAIDEENIDFNIPTVSHSSTESEIISLDTGLRLDGLPALELWDLIVSLLGNVSRVSDRSGKPESDEHKHHKSHNKIDVMKDIDAVP